MAFLVIPPILPLYINGMVSEMARGITPLVPIRGL